MSIPEFNAMSSMDNAALPSIKVRPIPKVCSLASARYNIYTTTNGLFPAFNFCFLPLIYFFYPEPRNLILEQDYRLFTGPKVQSHWGAGGGGK